MLLTIGLPWIFLSPVSKTSHFELSIMIGTRADIRFGCDQIAETFSMAALESSMPFVHIDVDDLRAAFHLLPRHRQRRFIIAGQDQFGERRRAGHVGPLADVDEIGFRANRYRFQSA